MHKAIGPDKLPTIVLKEFAESLAPSVTAVVNFGLRTGLQLTEWKKANVPPIHKKGKKDLVENYRPVSLLPVISRPVHLSARVSKREVMCYSTFGSIS